MAGRKVGRLIQLLCLLAAVALAGCAGTAGRHEAVIPIKEDVALSQFSNLELESRNAGGVPMLEYDHQRIRNLIVRKIIDKDQDRFAQINGAGEYPGTSGATLIFTRYEKGNAFARAMLIGLGQMHIDADMELEDATTGESIGTFRIKKTFAWGGLYGGFTRIEDAEDGFADAVVQVLFEEDPARGQDVP